MDISLELKGLPCLNKVYLLTYLLTYLREKERRMLTSHGVVHFTSSLRQHDVRMSLFQRMQVFWPEIEPYFCCCYTVLQKFRPESNLSRAYRGFLTVNSLEEFHWRRKNKRRNKRKSTSSYFTVKTALTQEEEVKQPQTQADQNCSFFLRLLLFLLQHFLLKTEHEAEDPRMFLSRFFFFLSTTQSTRFGFVRGFTKIAEAEGSLKKGFQKQCVSSLLPFSLD